MQFGTPRLLVRGTGSLNIWRNIATTGNAGRFIGIRTMQDEEDAEDEETPGAWIHLVENWTLDFAD